ncbi:ATP-dependent DNA helicase RecQ [Trichlorobacter thiogenes]|uniref:DNA helicase RecQ n=1 Tax=Trichlorobacter thiogenes TaxID=115783 RepID=A0A1T4L2H4_9BACT|nr:DNA helicase RecQ [Trichlorobacter thiogenes]SJZ48905.1 ATP-dependent DNA helicase RecQ [Trichlorobacter thiogenes]
MAASIQHTLKTVFGFHDFRPPQQEVIERVLAGEDVFLVMPTGGGKSLCYQIPALHRDGVAIVVSPLIALMKDQMDALIANGVRAACLNSSLSAAEAGRVFQQLDKGTLDLLYVAPERLLMPEFLERLGTLKLALFAIDEAHCISQWGHDFRPEYTQLGRLRPLFPGVPIVAMTATADPETRKDILGQLGLPNATVFVAGFDRPNITYTVIPKQKPLAQLGAFLRNRRDEAGIVYALSRKRVDQVAKQLQAAGFSAAAYHAGLPDDQRRRVQEAFQRDDIRIVVATVAFGMGIDKPNVRFVVHYDMPKSVESYYQETGRAGRDGLPSEALMLFGMGDVMTARKLIENSDNAERVRIEIQKLNAMVAYGEALTCRRRALLSYFGDQRDHDCGNCDICTDPPQRFDATVQAQKALSCVYRTGERFGMMHLIEVLRGSKNQRVLDLKHDKLSTWGIGADTPATQWENIIRQLIHLGYLTQDFTRFGALSLSSAARPVLKGETTVTLGMPRNTVETVERTRKRAGAKKDYDQALFDKLRALRKQIADAAKLPPFVVFSDATLAEMSRSYPQNLQQMRQVSGVGDRKLQQYGDAFLAEIRQYQAGDNETYMVA